MIHPTAIVAEGARIAEGVQIGPYSIIGSNVSIGEGTQVGPHCVIEGWTEIGRDNRILQFASIGAAPQDLKYRGEQTFLRIGDRNTIREFTTMNLGTVGGGGQTVVGNDNLFMAYTHVAHDCILGNRIVMANGSTLAGHVEVHDFAILGGLSAIHQFTRIGSHVMISGGSMVTQDIPPYVIAQGDRATTVGLNSIGLKRRGFTEEALRELKKAYKLIFRSNLRVEEALDRIAQEVQSGPEVDHFVDFIRKSERGVAR